MHDCIGCIGYKIGAADFVLYDAIYAESYPLIRFMKQNCIKEFGKMIDLLCKM